MTSRQEAEALAGRIRAYWANRVQFPAIWVEQAAIDASQTDHRLHWVVRSDLVNGRPAPLRPESKTRSEPKSDSASRFPAMARAHRAGKQIESVALPQSPWDGIGANWTRNHPHPHHGA